MGMLQLFGSSYYSRNDRMTILTMIQWLVCFLIYVPSITQLTAVCAFSVAPTIIRTSQQQRHSTLLFASPPISSSSSSTLQIGQQVGRGSYGIVHICNLGEEQLICKRPYVLKELALKYDDPQERVQRCKYYAGVEQHCFEKLSPHSQIPKFRGMYKDSEDNEWMTFDMVAFDGEDGQKVTCPSLQQVMDADWKLQHNRTTFTKEDNDVNHHLETLTAALGLEVNEEDSFATTIDTVFESILTVLTHVHEEAHIVHRDVKPGNLLVDPIQHTLVLIDFGSAADMDPISTNKWLNKYKRVGLEDHGRVAVSPIYSAPEVWIQPNGNPENFDVYSSALIVCQLLFNYLDERTDAGFHQQLQDAGYDLDTWLSRELASKVRPAGLDEALEYLSTRKGMWRLLREMLRKDPEQRISSTTALQKWKSIKKQTAIPAMDDGPFFDSVVSMMEECVVVPPTVQRALHYVATFRRSLPLGLVLSEIDPTIDDPKWKEATKNAQLGDVFVKEITPDSQADQMGIFEVGDQLQGVGELPVAGRGFSKVVEMLEQQPQSQKYVTLHLDRQASARPLRQAVEKGHAQVVAQGAWSRRGQRKVQEDTFVLHEIHEEQDILLAGVFDGHGGTAASAAACEMVPYLMSETLRQEDNVRHALEKAWETTCETYRNGCLNGEECLADYDPVEGTLKANTGSLDLVAGTTASLVAVQEGNVTILNCGDSRSLLIDGSNGKLLFETQDHSPETEMDRLSSDPNYSTPKCSLSRWYLSVGDYQYAVARSLEGPFATSKGIVSTPDIYSLPTASNGILVVATDGLFEVMGNEEVGRDVVQFRREGDSAGDAAKKLAAIAIEKGTSDNVSVVVIYLGP